MSPLLWSVAAVALGLLLLFMMNGGRRSRHTRHVVLEEVKRRLRGGSIEHLPARGPRARGRLGELEVTVDLHHEPGRRNESPMWRVMAVGPVRVDEPMEARVADWGGWIDPWMQMEKVLSVPGGSGPAFTIHARQSLTLDHPVIVALRRQGPGLVAGCLHVQHDFMRAEIHYDPRPEDNRGLFAFLDAMSEISAHGSSRHMEAGRIHRLHVGRETG